MWPTVVILLGFSSKISGVCRQSFQTLCDNFEDYYPIADSVTELIVGSENSEGFQMMSIDSETIRLSQMRKLKAMTILEKIKDMERYTFYGNRRVQLDYLKFYGNNIRRLRPSTFLWMRVKRFSFENNNLEVLQGNAFGRSHFLTINLSHNKIEEIEDDVLSDTSLEAFGTEELIITHNKLRTIKPNSFPSSLKILKLDHNDLSNVDQVFDNLTLLQELTVSHNLLNSIPNLTHAQNLIYIDFSFNVISYLTSKDFETLPKLNMINLNHNLISNPGLFDTFKPPIKPKVKLIFDVGYNHLTHLTRNDTLTNIVPILYGNPWNCKCWPRIQKLIPDRDDCDLHFFGNGNAPFCIDIAEADCASKLNFTDKKPLQPFLRLRENAVANCILTSYKPAVVVF